MGQILLKMDISAEKLSLIEWLIQLNDQKVLNEIKALKEQNEVEDAKEKLDPVILQEMVTRALASEKAIAEGKTSDISSIIEEDWD